MKQIARIALALSATALLAGCYPYASGPQPAPPPRPIPQPMPRPPVDQPNFAWVQLGQTRNVDGIRVTPLRVLEDSRCPMNARCIRAGEVRLLVRIDTGRNRAEREIRSNQPIRVADGTLELVQVQPEKRTDREIRPRDYRFGIRFMGGY